MIHRLKKLLGILTGSRRHRWERALAIHESHRWDQMERDAREAERTARTPEEASAARVKWANAVYQRAWIGHTWIGKRPEAP